MKTTFLPLLLTAFYWFASSENVFGQSDSIFMETDSVIIQLDSVFIDGEIITVTDSADSAHVYNIVQVTLHFDYIEDLGNLTVVAYESLSGAPIGEFVRSRQQLIDEGLLLSDHITWPLFPAEPGLSYRIEATPQSLSGAYTRIGSILLSN